MSHFIPPFSSFHPPSLFISFPLPLHFIPAILFIWFLLLSLSYLSMYTVGVGEGFKADQIFFVHLEYTYNFLLILPIPPIVPSPTPSLSLPPSHPLFPSVSCLSLSPSHPTSERKINLIVQCIFSICHYVFRLLTSIWIGTSIDSFSSKRTVI